MLHEKYASLKNTITSTFIGNIEGLIALSKLRNYHSSIEASLFDDNIAIDVYNNLIDTVSEHIDVSCKYFDLKKKCLKLDEL